MELHSTVEAFWLPGGILEVWANIRFLPVSVVSERRMLDDLFRRLGAKFDLDVQLLHHCV